MPADVKAILKIEVPVIVQIASRTMPLQEVTNLAPGAIIELPKLADEELEILVSDKAIGLGRAVKVGENFGVRVTFIGDLHHRIKAIGTADLSGSAERSESASQSPAAPLAEQLVPKR